MTEKIKKYIFLNQIQFLFCKDRKGSFHSVISFSDLKNEIITELNNITESLTNEDYCNFFYEKLKAKIQVDDYFFIDNSGFYFSTLEFIKLVDEIFEELKEFENILTEDEYEKAFNEEFNFRIKQ